MKPLATKRRKKDTERERQTDRETETDRERERLCVCVHVCPTLISLLTLAFHPAVVDAVYITLQVDQPKHEQIVASAEGGKVSIDNRYKGKK